MNRSSIVAYVHGCVSRQSRKEHVLEVFIKPMSYPCTSRLKAVRAVAAACGICAGVFCASPAQAQYGPPAKFEPPGNSVYHGASLPDTWSETGLETQLRQYQQVAGKRLCVVTWFASVYENGNMTSWSQSYLPVLTRVKRDNAISLIKFSTQDDNYNANHKMADLKQISEGVYDAYFQQMAQAVKQFGGPVFISIDHEMNGTWYPYSQGFPGSTTTAQDFVSAWQHIVNMFHSAGANNAAFVWSPNVPDVGGIPASSYYPGDQYVDWVGCSFYSGNDATALEPLYNTYAARKPFFVTEWATAPEKSQYYQGYPGDAAWVKQTFDAFTSLYPRVKAISWFNWNKDDGNYLLQRDPGQAQVYATDIQSPRYLDSPGAIQTADALDVPRLDTPPPEIVLNEAQPVQTAPVVAPKRERIHLELVPTE